MVHNKFKMIEDNTCVEDCNQAIWYTVYKLARVKLEVNTLIIVVGLV
jgi:hypothetical protein